jgi:hypothetical protein
VLRNNRELAEIVCRLPPKLSVLYQMNPKFKDAFSKNSCLACAKKPVKK